MRFSIHLLICLLVFLQSSCRGLQQPCNASKPNSGSQWNNKFVCKDGLDINSTNWYLNLKLEDVEEEIKSVVKNFEYEDNIVEDLIMAANVHIIALSNPSRGQLVDSQFFRDGYPAYRNAELITEVSRRINDKYCQIYRTNAIQCAKGLMKIKLDRTSLGGMCLSEYYNKTACIGKNLMYRSPDGSCNNLKRSSLGKSITAYKRLLPPVYLDGVNTVRTLSLPKPRYLSNALAKDHTPDPVKTMAIAYWTFFIGHDLSHTAMSNMRKSKKSLNCCDNKGLNIPSSLKHKLCMEVEIPDDDPFYSQIQGRRVCMNYVRSVPAVRSDCTFGPREQMNQATHYLDGSMIYGSVEKQTWSLRTKSNGQLLTDIPCKKQGELLQSQYMPREDTDSNACQYGAGTCYRAGDIRASGLPQLTVMHTLWMREHNRLAKQLSNINPNWDDERIFQEARKIVIASIQHITYAEWLPALLGENYTRQNGLEPLTEGYSKAYNDTIDPAVSNSFATAILPFSYSMISDKLNLYSEDRKENGELSLNNHFNQPNHVMVNFFDQLVRGLSTQNTFEVHMGFTSELTNNLYKYRPIPESTHGMDLLSLVIQRNRDHGIPSYTQFRKYCGLKNIENKQDMLEIMNPIVLKMYRTLDDIELFIGALFEKHEDDAMVGPTMRCIIREQFLRTRIADRYFYDLPKIFNEYQLAEIRKVTLARVFCDNSNNITTMQNRVFLKPTTLDLHLCNSQSIPKINLNHWLEKVDTI